MKAGAPDFRLVVRVIPARTQPGSAEQIEGVKRIVDELSGAEGMQVTVAEKGSTPDVYIVVADAGVTLCRSYERSETEESRANTFGPFQHGPELAHTLGDSLRIIAKALNLRSIAQFPSDGIAGNGVVKNVAVEVSVEKWNAAKRAFEPIKASDDLTLRDGDQVRVSVKNVGRSPVDVTILYVESGFRIISYFPTLHRAMTGGFDNRVSPGQTALTEFRINDETVGLEDVIVIAVEERPEMRQHFAFLEQQGLRGAERGMGATPLSKLLNAAAFGAALRGGGRAAELSEYSVQRVSWTVVSK
jgi:hypothetical protein